MSYRQKAPLLEHDRAQPSCDMLRIQHRLFLALHQVRDLPQTLRLCMDALLEIADMECGVIYLTEESGALQLAHADGLSAAFVETIRWYAPDALPTRLIMDGKPLYGRPDDWEAALIARERQEGLRTIALLPLPYKGHIVGGALVASRTTDTIPRENQLALDTMASLVGLLIREAQADQALRTSDDRYEATFEQAAVGIAQVAPNGRWLRVNRKLCEILGYSRDELLQLDFQTITPADSLQADLESVRRLLAHEVDSYSTEKRYIRKDGTTVWINLTVSLNRTRSGEPDYIVAVIEDIQARKRVEETLWRFSRVIDQTTSKVIITDTNGIIEYVNPRVVEISGYAATQLLGKPVGMLKSGLTMTPEYRMLWPTLRNGGVWRGELCNRRKDGSLCWESAIVSPLRDESGRIANYVSIQDDITERKRATAALKESEAVLRKAQRMARIGHWKRDLRGGVAVWSAEIYRIFGRDPALPAPTHDEMSHYFTPASWTRLWAAIQAALKDGTPYDVDAEIVRADGSRRWLNSHGEIERDDSGAIVVLNGMVQDITERKVAEQAQNRLTRSLALLSQCRQVLVHAENEQQLLNEVCRLGVEVGGYLMSWVGMVGIGADKNVYPMAQSGYEEGYLDSIKVTWDDTPHGCGPKGMAIKTGKTVVNQDCLTNPHMAPWREAAVQRGYQSSIALPLFVNQRVIGAFTLYSAEPFAFGAEEVALLEELTADLSYGIEMLGIRAEHREAEAALAMREAQYRAVIDTTTDGFWLCSTQGQLLAVNDAYVHRSGYSREELLTMRVTDLEAQESVKQVEAHIARIHATGVDLFETLHRTRDGEIWPVEVSAAYWPEAGGRIFVFLRDTTQRMQLKQQIIEMGTAEQERIGREIHDGIGQHLTAIGMMANGLERKLIQRQHPEEAAAAGELVRHMRQVLIETKALAKGLSPIQIGPDGLADALSLLVERVQEWAGVHCRLSCTGKMGALDEMTAVHLYRIAQEAINNTVKHAQATAIEVALEDSGGTLTLAVRDDGSGIDPARESEGGLGLHIMHYRAGIIGAHLAIEPAAEGGTLVECKRQWRS